MSITRYLRFSLRSLLLLGITVYSVLLVGFVRLGLVEALEFLTFGTGLAFCTFHPGRGFGTQSDGKMAGSPLISASALQAARCSASFLLRPQAAW